tara:strand:- start:736 stop:939 length:204 start_codon:yes stop_codon:yes gene_type:complete
MLYAKAVSAKSYSFDKNGMEEKIDFERMATIIKNLNFEGYVSVEFEGDNITEDEGIKATKSLLENVF